MCFLFNSVALHLAVFNTRTLLSSALENVLNLEFTACKCLAVGAPKYKFKCWTVYVGHELIPALSISFLLAKEGCYGPHI